MIDLHSHILPGIDDGAKNLQDTLAMARDCVSVGVTHLMCTPHLHIGVYNNDVKSIVRAFELAKTEIKQEGIPLKLAVACECRLCPQVMDLVNNQQLPFMGHWHGKLAMLLELPHSHIPAGTETLIKWLHKQNIQTIIPHVERNREVIADFPKAFWLKQLGCLFQATAGAFVNRFSDAVFTTAWRMLDNNLVSYIASDTHSVSRRPNDMQRARRAISLKYNKTDVDALFLTVPAQITQHVKWQ